MALKKTCSCGILIPFALPYCEACQARRNLEQAARHKYYDQYKRDKESAAFYNSLEWQCVRAAVMRRFMGLDLYEYYINKQIVYAEAVHHIVELSADWNLRIDINNLIPLTASNHSMIHKLYQKDKRKAQQVLISLLRRWEDEYGQ